MEKIKSERNFAMDAREFQLCVICFTVRGATFALFPKVM
jgi:hypothetical protein